ncbi:diguanylate cyclase (GGDEF) domain-containing protein [Trichlorobacter thiogenes]|uniref:diguanylate cyclase n=2 Tax=Trichlorobacter thiogenes TaxID=115783 RepID=A0A1T4R8Q5_9BACT|nr:diguanylate cyclase (GGDEF) domain-containing protein [Trichlorobacter thiogenes]
MLSFRFRLTLVQKMILSFAVSGVCLTAALVYALAGLDAMHRVEEEFARKDLKAVTMTIGLRDAILAQERALGKYLILNEQVFRDVFDRNVQQFNSTLFSFKQIYQGNKLRELESSYRAYHQASQKIFAGNSAVVPAMKQSAERIEKIIAEIRDEQQESLVYKLKTTDEQETKTVSRSIFLASFGVVLSSLIAVLLIYSFARSIGKLQKATHRIAEGEFDYDPEIPPGDEIGTLAKDFSRMALRLKELEQISLDASPLTRLPGNIAIERAIHQRLAGTTPFAVCYLDLDNFKSYNDRYGYIKASDLIREAGRVIYDAVHGLQEPQAFVGHIGGDDFVVIISDGKADAACQAIIHAIDALIPDFYSAEDRLKGAIEGIDRYGVQRVFPLISISISALVCTPGSCGSAAEIATAAAQLKDQVKKETGSNYCIVRRGAGDETVLE